MDIQKLKDLADRIEPRQPEYLDMGGHKVCKEIRDLKAQVRELMEILIEEATPKGKKKAKAFKC